MVNSTHIRKHIDRALKELTSLQKHLEEFQGTSSEFTLRQVRTAVTQINYVEGILPTLYHQQQELMRRA
jgi:hypothetical protein